MKKYIFLAVFLIIPGAHAMDNNVAEKLVILSDSLNQLAKFLGAAPEEEGVGEGEEKPKGGRFAGMSLGNAIEEAIRLGKRNAFKTRAEALAYLKKEGNPQPDLGLEEAQWNYVNELVQPAAEPESKITFEQNLEKLKSMTAKTLGAAEKTGAKFANIETAENVLKIVGLEDRLSKDPETRNKQLRPFVEGAAAEEPVKKPETPRKKITILTLTQELKAFGEMRSGSPEEERNKKTKAKEILNDILELSSQALNPANVQKIKNAVVNDILSVDPLLISTASIVLFNIGTSRKDIYATIINYYNEALQSIKKEFAQAIARKGGGFRGLCEDIDDALSYPIELASEIQNAKTIVEFNRENRNEAQDFVTKIDALHKEILQLLQDASNQRVLNDCGFNINLLLNIFDKKERQYCVANPGWKRTLFKDELDEVIQNISNYEAKKAKLSRIERTYTVQNIITMLNGFLDHVTNKDYCPICLEDEIKELAKDMVYANQTFRRIGDFLQTVRREENNLALNTVINEILPKLKDAIRQKGCPVE